MWEQKQATKESKEGEMAEEGAATVHFGAMGSSDKPSA